MSVLKWLADLFRRSASPKPPVTGPPSQPPTVDSEEFGTLLQLHNGARGTRGTPPLSYNRVLAKVAQDQAEYCAERRKVDHQSRDGKNIARRCLDQGYGGWTFAENAAATFTHDAREAWDKWSGSPPHLQNAVNFRLRDVGFGAARGADGLTYWVAVYGG